MIVIRKKDFYNEFVSELRQTYFPDENHSTSNNKKYHKVSYIVECFSNYVTTYNEFSVKLCRTLKIEKKELKLIYNKYVYDKSSLNEFFNKSTFRNFKIFSEFKKGILDNVSNIYDLDLVKDYLFEVTNENFVFEESIYFANTDTCLSFAKKYHNDISDINHLVQHMCNIHYEDNDDMNDIEFAFNSIRTCYMIFCEDLIFVNSPI